MHMTARFLLLSALSLAFLPCNLLAQRQTLNIDSGKFEVHFTLGDALHAVHGTFHVESGNIGFDREDGQMSGTIVVDARSGDSGNSSRDQKMTKDELKASSFSTVTFAPKHYTGMLTATGDSTITVEGTFTLLGVPHEISVPMQVHIDGTQCKATGSFDVPYVKWGMKDPSNFLLHAGKNVTISLVLFGSIAE